MKDQMEKLIGESAPADYIENIKILVMSCDVRIKDVDRIIAYYSGSKYNVEVELILSEDMTVGKLIYYRLLSIIITMMIIIKHHRKNHYNLLSINILFHRPL